MMDPDGEEVWSDEEMDGVVDDGGHGSVGGLPVDADEGGSIGGGLSLSLSAASEESSGLSEEGTCTTGSSGSSRSSTGHRGGGSEEQSSSPEAADDDGAVRRKEGAASSRRGGGGAGKKRRAAAMMATSGDDHNNKDEEEVRAAKKRPHRATVGATEGTAQVLPPSSSVAARDKKRSSKSKSQSKKSKKKKSKKREKSGSRGGRDVQDGAPQIDGDGGSSLEQSSSSGGSQSSIPSFGNQQAPRRQRSQTSMGSVGENVSLPGLGRSPSNEAFFRSLPSFSFSDVAGQFGGNGGSGGGAMSTQAQSTAASLHDLQANLEAALAGYNNTTGTAAANGGGGGGGSASEAAASLAATAAATAAAANSGGAGGGGSAADGLLLHSHSLASLFDTGGSASAAAAAAAAASTDAQSQSNLLGGPATAALGTSNSTNSLFLASLPGWNTGAGTAPQPIVPVAAAASAAPPADAAASVSQRKPQAKKGKDKSKSKSKSSSDTKAQSKSKKKSSTGSNKKRRQELQQPQHQQASVSSASGGSSGNAPTKVTESSSSAHESSSSSNEDRAPRAQQVLPAQPPNPPVQPPPQFQQPLPQPVNQHNHHHHNQHGRVQQQQQQQPQQLHPLAMQSTANCPPIQPGLTATPAGLGMLPFLAFNPAGLASMLGSAVPNASASAAGIQGMGSAAPSLVQQNNNAAAAMAAAATQGMNPALAVFQQQQRALAAALAQHLQQQQQQQQNSSAAINPATVVVPPAPPSNQDRKPPAKRVATKPPAKKNRKATVASSSGNTSSSSTDIPSASSASAMGGSNTSSSGTTVPPFYLFDAPYELRMNFLQSQRMHDASNTAVGAAAMPASSALPTPALTPGDPNSYHYGMAVSGVSVNGFHPQLNAMSNPTLPLSGINSMGLAAATSASMIPSQQGAGQNQNVRLLDGRSFRPEPAKKIMSKAAIKERNEREQRRAQKIAELIEKLRLSMVKGGWKVEMKSKYHTLSTCADYVKHLVELTKAKEAAIEQAKSDLEEKKQERLERKKKAAEEGEGGDNHGELKPKADNIPPASDANAIMQDSDPESETSSLTAFSSGEGADDGKEERVRRSKKIRAASSSSDDVDRDGEKKTASTNTGKRKHGSTSDPPSPQKKVRLSTSGNKSSSAADDSLSSDESGPGGKNISLDKMSSSVSEMTDSNQSSSMVDIDTGVHDADRSTSSISSTAAVGPPRGGSREKIHRHADVVIKEKQPERKGRKRKTAEGKEKTSLDEDFELDYSEVFHTANVPQLIATPAGKVVTWNDFFLRATGLSGEEAKRLSIFSIVQADKLSTLFELVANALKNGATKKRNRRRGRKRLEPSTSWAGSGPGIVNNRAECCSVAGSAAASATTGSSGTGSEMSTASSYKPVDYSAVTLPCVPFQATYPKSSVAVEKKKDYDTKEAGGKGSADAQEVAGPEKDEKAKAEADLSIPLYMTVTLMSDDDPRKRCFHCVLTDTPATSSGKIGVVTPELLAMLFTEDDDEDEDEEGNGPSRTNKTGSQATALVSSDKSSEITREDDANAESGEQKMMAT